MHLSLQPLPGFSIGVNRILQFGGGERGGDSFRDIVEAFFDPSGADNTGAGGDRDSEFGNQAERLGELGDNNEKLQRSRDAWRSLAMALWPLALGELKDSE